jgi:hypothetical protein
LPLLPPPSRGCAASWVWIQVDRHWIQKLDSARDRVAGSAIRWGTRRVAFVGAQQPRRRRP